MYLIIKHKEKVKKVVFSEQFHNFEYLKQFCVKIFGVRNFSIYYFDEHEDVIKIDSDEDILLMKFFDDKRLYYNIYLEVCEVD